MNGVQLAYLQTIIYTLEWAVGQNLKWTQEDNGKEGEKQDWMWSMYMRAL